MGTDLTCWMRIAEQALLSGGWAGIGIMGEGKVSAGIFK